MNKKKGLIISICGIIFVLLALIGFTYGFYMSIISGNENSKKVTLQAGESKLTYIDLSTDEVNDIIAPGYTNTKFFTVQNTGDISASYYIYLVDVLNEYIRKEDIVYTIYRKVGDTSVAPEDVDTNVTDFSDWENISSTQCPTISQYTSYGDCQYPSEKSLLLNSKETIENQNEYYIYAFRVEYINQPDIDQVDDGGNKFSGRVIISSDDEGNATSPFENGTLADAIVENAIINANGTSFKYFPETNVAEETSLSSYGKIDPTTYPTIKSNLTTTNTYTYASDYTIDSSGNFSLVNPKTLVYSEGYETLKGKYIVSTNGATAEETSSSIYAIYKVSPTDVYEDSFNYISVNKYISNERSLSLTKDDHGTSYYFRGGVEDNYVNFADMCWRIVRIAGDGSIKLILEDQDNECENSNGNWNIPISTGSETITGNYGYTEYAKESLTASDGTTNSNIQYIMNYLHGETNTESSMALAFKNFQSTFTLEELQKLKSGDWCISDIGYTGSISVYNGPLTFTKITEDLLDLRIKGTALYYDSYARLSDNKTNDYEPTLKCNVATMDDWNDSEESPTAMYVGTLTADEVIYAGSKFAKYQYAIYLLNDYQRGKSLDFWTLSPSYVFLGMSDRLFVFDAYGYLTYKDVKNNISFRPAISLKSGTEVVEGGNGTKNTPYKIK